jgi:hypothetical protein
MLLPTFARAPYDGNGQYNPSLICPYLHPRTAANLHSKYADLLYWPGLYNQYPNVTTIPMKSVIEAAFKKREAAANLISNSHPQFKQNLP